MVYTTTPKISLIIPVYNVAQYLDRCLKSITEQTYKNIEIILVNDGSTDDSLDILKAWAKKDMRISIINQNNQGLSSARNKGIAVSTGQYITFIDSDDYVTKDYIEYLFWLLKKDNFNSPLAICSLMDVNTQNNKQRNMGNGIEVKLTGKDCIRMMCYHNLVDTCAYAKLGKRELYNDHFFPKGKLFEDIGSTYKLFESSKSVMCGFKPKYYYMLRSNSIVTGKFKNNKLDLLEMTDQMAESVNSVYPDLINATLRRQVYARFSTLNQTIGEKNVKEIQSELIEYLQKNKRKVLSDPLTPKRDRLAYFFLGFGLPVYKLMWKGYLMIKR